MIDSTRYDVIGALRSCQDLISFMHDCIGIDESPLSLQATDVHGAALIDALNDATERIEIALASLEAEDSGCQELAAYCLQRVRALAAEDWRRKRSLNDGPR